MRFTPLKFDGAYVIDLEQRDDERGFFARTWCVTEFAALGLTTSIRQSSISFNARQGTLRGVHYQVAPDQETKVVRCTAGAIYDVLVDVREKSPTYGEWLAFELTARNRRQLYIPHGVAHGFQTLCDASEVLYQISTDYSEPSARGIRWNDPALRIQWPDPDSAIISQKDRSYRDFRSNSTSA